MDDDDKRPRTKGYILFNEKTGEFLLPTAAKNKHDSWQAAEVFRSRAKLKKDGWKCVPCMVSL
jgi:hypothetical protein